MSSEKIDAHRREVRNEVVAGARLDQSFIVMNGLATVVASYGLLADSPAVVIGAMIIATLLGPITGMALAIVDGDTKLLRNSLIAESAGVILVLITSYAVGFAHREIPLTHEILSRTKPNILDLMIAVAGGAAGAYASVSKRVSVGLVGVAIATALVPPLASCGLLLARHQPSLAFGGFLLFLANLVAIQFASSIVLWLHGYHEIYGKGQTAGRVLLRTSLSALILLVLGVVFGVDFSRSLGEQIYAADVRKSLTASLHAFPGVDLVDLSVDRQADKYVVTATIRTPYSFDPTATGKLEDQLPHPQGATAELHIRSVISKETTREGYLHQLDEESPSDPPSP